MKYTIIFFDIDNTLYPQDCGLWNTINERVNGFIQKRLNVPREEISALRDYCRQSFGTTLSGLMNKFDFDAEEYLTYIYDIDLSEYLQPDWQTREILLQYPQRKIIFTNASRNHALRVLSALKLNNIFERIIDIHNFYPYNKSQKEAFETAFRIMGLSEYKKCVLVDDMVKVLDIAKNFDMYTICINKEPPPREGNHVFIHEVKELPLVLSPD